MHHALTPPTAQPSFADLFAALRMSSTLSDATRREYASAVARTPRLSGCNRLEDVPLDLDAFKRRFPLAGFHPSRFKSEKAYQAWRRKVVAAIKGHLGIIAAERARRVFDDGWATLLAAAMDLVAGSTDWHERQLIPLRILAAEARREGFEPQDLNSARFAAMAGRLLAGRRRSFVRAARTLERLREQSREIDALLPSGPAGDLIAPVKAAPPPRLIAEALVWVEDYCRGEHDDVLDVWVNARAPATSEIHVAALRRYLATAQRIGALTETDSLGTALRGEVFNRVVRAWILAENGEAPLTPSSMAHYVGCLKRIAIHNGLDVTVMERSMSTNRQLRDGRAQQQRMSPEAMRFCAWLLSTPHAALLFRSLHVRFFNLCREHLAHEKAGRSRTCDAAAIVQLGVLAAIAAVAVWGAPLRIGNMRRLRLFGEKPSIIMPGGRNRDVLIDIPAAETKRRKRIQQSIVARDSPARDNRAVEILEWYIREIRPRLPSAKDSPYLFPGFADGKPIGGGTIRKWLRTHGRGVGIVMTPHKFRHGVATLYLRAHPDGYEQIARLLDDTPEVVKRYYAWIDDAQALADVQRRMLQLGGIDDAPV